MMIGRSGPPADSLSTAKSDGPKLTIVTKQERGDNFVGRHHARPAEGREGRNHDVGPVLVTIVLHDDDTVVNHGRARRAPLVGRVVDEPNV